MDPTKGTWLDYAIIIGIFCLGFYCDELGMETQALLKHISCNYDMYKVFLSRGTL